jgi:cytochrome c-type biogenesis protein CcmH
MFFWIIAAVMTFAACAALLLPLLGRRGRDGAVSAKAHDVEVYRDQLAEIDRDLAAGQIDAQEAEVARAEIGRRLLGAAREVGDGQAAPARKTGRRYVAAAILVLLPVVVVPAYLELGAPGAEQLPLSARLSESPDNADISVLVANAEHHLAANPDDGRGWDVLAPIYLRMSRLEDAEMAFRKAIALLGPSAQRQAGLGETIVSQAGGIVTEEARLIFQSARELDPEDPRPVFFLAVSKAQEGKTQEAKAQFQALLDRSDPEAPWVPAIRREIAALENAPAGNGSVNVPTPAEVAAAADGKTPEERDEMIRSMVATLESRLADNPDNFDGWQMLIRSQAVLGDRASAQRSLNRALAVFSSAPQASALTKIGSELGLDAKAELGGVPMAAAEPPASTATAGSARTAVPDDGPFIVPGGATGPITSGSATTLGDPSPEAIEEAGKMAADDRQAMIRSMVASLDEKLTAEPNNLDGWLRLIRSYAVLGQREDARNAVLRARTAFGGDAEKIAAIDGLAGELAITERN